MNAQEKFEKFIVATVRSVMEGRNFDVDIQPVGQNQLETIMGKSNAGDFKIVFDKNKIYVNANGKEATFNDVYSKNFRALHTIKNNCYGYRDNHYFRNDKGEWVKLPKKAGLFARMFGRKVK
ncbi:MAG: hypothetical protein IJQ90_03610 [Alphaproteobacteria bacterium]|nr:hypothetical protein [Alphaproteobacteria bacterium]